MRFFSGVRGGGGDGKKKVSPSELFKLKMSGKAPEEKTMADKYQEMIEAKMDKMIEDVILGRKKALAKVPGMKSASVGVGDDEFDVKPKEPSKNAKMMLKMLAMKKVNRERKKERKKAIEELWSMKSKKKQAAMDQAAKEAAEYQKQQDDAAAAAAAAVAATESSSWNSGWGTTSSDDKGGWW